MIIKKKTRGSKYSKKESGAAVFAYYSDVAQANYSLNNEHGVLSILFENHLRSKELIGIKKKKNLFFENLCCQNGTK